MDEATQTNSFLTADQVASKLQVCRLTVYRLISAGKLAAYRIGKGAWRIEEADLAAFLTECRSGTEPT